jgi:hypothetical protein
MSESREIDGGDLSGFAISAVILSMAMVVAFGVYFVLMDLA